MTLGMMRNLSLQRREVMMMSDARKATTTLQFNGKNVDTSLKEYLESVTYTDVASGSSDTLAISLQNIDEKWMKGWYPKKGDVVKGSIKFLDWDQEGQDKKLSCGSFTLDEIKFSGIFQLRFLPCQRILQDQGKDKDVEECHHTGHSKGNRQALLLKAVLFRGKHKD